MAIMSSLVADITVSNTTTETSILAAPIVFPADTLVAGTTIRINLQGIIGTKSSAVGTFRIRGRTVGALTDVFADTTALTPAVSLDSGYDLNIIYVVRTAGLGNGATMAMGSMAFYGHTSVITPVTWGILPDGGTHVIDTTASNTLDIKAQWGTANAANTFSVLTGVIELVTGAG